LKPAAGFSLIEIAVVMFIMVLLLGSILIPLTTQVEQRQIADAQKKLDEIKDALIGFAIANGRLPCPASTSSAGVESPSGGGDCTNDYDGFVPAVTLGITATNDQGFAVDPWGNRIRYAVTNANSDAFTTANGMSSTGLSSLSPNLFVCSTATGIGGSNCDTGKTLATGVPAVIYSTGKNGSYGGTDLDERANPNPNSSDNNRGFVYHTPTPSTATNGEFDDIMVWLSPNILYNRMVAAGKLP
jgi:type II secretory pathway pseudopilin PulG